ncbi:hypothetical protein [Rhodosalinus sediminis]|jgi:hypothetical protein|uniref:hypothetical protein n=1 Tax=Rhodosalinus sediminis TaxID=1940533 RepID=UPI002354500A|nr:hypothetical protein [Rhodosalinus sediminis]
MADMTWTKRRLAEILNEDRGLPDEVAAPAAEFTETDLTELPHREREAALSAFARAARESRDARAGQGLQGEDVPAYKAEDIRQGLRGARAALESFPAGERSARGDILLANCRCRPLGGPED